ncbi:thiamine ABC transporter ATP-binding protein [Dongia soli]|uniref:Thiamine ABC transporter ATP-binding protein n=1 Tax=Dongia soli TaxID=600628 RepID=A0ABU5EHP9_9PROT|nr:thiamine ABC transporter ATP-binding protein [Dongia soli]MDY0885050.1 thiamine ABC transporter ATP-binding protein [Dongia soli]
MTAYLECRALRFRYEEMMMRFDLEIERGSCVAVIGPSGAGKSTLLALIGGFEHADDGCVLVEGRDITAVPAAQRPVTTLFQDNNLFAHLTASQNVGLGLHPGLRLSDAQRRDVGQALEQVGLEEFGNRRPAQLSGGERQRVAIARCLVRRRPILLLDEPFGALGPAMRLEMLDLVDALRRQHGLTVLMVTHDPADAARIADRTAFVAEGEVVLSDATTSVLQSDLPVIRDYLGR